MLTMLPMICRQETVKLEYAYKSGCRREKEQKKPDVNKDREQLKTFLYPWIQETLQKLLKEERDYYKSRPSLAARHYGSFFQATSMQRMLLNTMSGEVYAQVKERMRLESIRKGK